MPAPEIEPHAVPAPGAIEWDAPASCPSREAFERALHEKLARPPWTIEDDVRLVVVVTEAVRGPEESTDAAPSFTARIYWIVAREPIHTRTIAGRDCATVVELAAEIAALAATPTLQALDEQRTATPPAEPEPCPERPAPPPAPAASPPAPAPRARPRLGVATAALGGVGLGETPQVGGVLRARVDLLASRFRIGAQAHYRFERRAGLEGSGGGVRVSAWTVGPRGCAIPRLGPIELPVCAEVMLGQLRGRPYGLADERSSASLWAHGGLGLGVWWPIRPSIAIGADAVGYVAFRRPAFDTVEGIEIVRAAPAGFVLGLGIEGRFGPIVRPPATKGATTRRRARPSPKVAA